METPGKSQIWKPKWKKKGLTVGLLWQTKTSLSNLKKLQKLKHVDSYIDLVECLANISDWKKINPKTGRIERERPFLPFHNWKS